MNRVYPILAAALSVPMALTAQSTNLPNIPNLPNVTCSVVGPVAPQTSLLAILYATSGGNTSCVNVSGSITGEGKLRSIRLSGVQIGGFGVVDLLSTMNADPFITFGVTTTNFVAGPVTYSFLFGTPVDPD